MIDSLSNATYLNHLNQHELMTAKEELELGRLIEGLSESLYGIHSEKPETSDQFGWSLSWPWIGCRRFSGRRESWVDACSR